MITWMDVRAKIPPTKLASKTWISDQKNLMKVVDWAELAGLEPADASHASLSNLRTIIKAAKKAVALEDSEHLAKLFQLAAKLPTGDLRLKIGSKQRDVIKYEVSKVNGKPQYRITFSAEQFSRIRQSTKQYFLYQKSIAERK
ncbi:MAG: hypothetical protein NTW69_13660 [Chloroflexi bacterium]|nr:hypothetical protein [Chloroflexota bacterium]